MTMLHDLALSPLPTDVFDDLTALAAKRTLRRFRCSSGKAAATIRATDASEAAKAFRGCTDGMLRPYSAAAACGPPAGWPTSMRRRPPVGWFR